MALVTITSSTTTASVIRGDIMRPLVGVWTADLVIDQPDGTGFDPGTQVTIASENGYELKGTVDPNRQGAFLDAVHVRVLGGAGGMLKDATARAYVQPGAYVRDVLNGLCSDSGESISSTVDSGFLLTNLAAWSVLGGNTVARNLRALLNIVAPSYNWRILADGTLWIGLETWSSATSTFDVLWQDPADQSFHLGSESPFIEPGTNVSSIGNVSRVQDTIQEGQLRSRVWVDIPGTDRGLNAAMQSIAKQALCGVDYYALYVCQVVSQSSDLTTVDVQPVGARNQALIGSLQRVPVRLAAGVKVQMAPGSTMLLGWDGGNPEGPYVTAGLISDAATTISLEAGSSLTVKAGGATVLQASPTSLALGLVGTLPVLVQGSTDSIFGAPIQQNPAAIATIVKAG